MPRITTALERWADQWLLEADGAERHVPSSVYQLLAENRLIWLAHMQAQNEEDLSEDATPHASY